MAILKKNSITLYNIHCCSLRCTGLSLACYSSLNFSSNKSFQLYLQSVGFFYFCFYDVVVISLNSEVLVPVM